MMSDSPRITTGFANIGRHVAQRLHDSGKWDVHYIGWFDSPENNIAAPYPIYHTMRDKEGRPVREDSYGYRSMKPISEHVKPDVVLTIGDSLTADRRTVVRGATNKDIHVMGLEELFEWFAPTSDVIKDSAGREIIDCAANHIDLEALTVVDGESAWRPLTHITRHIYQGTVARVRQKYGETICTHNHSLVDSNGEKATPIDMIGRHMYQIDSIPREYIIDSIDVATELGIRGTASEYRKYDYDDNYVWSVSCPQVKIKRFIKGDDLHALCRLIGAYASEGSADYLSKSNSNHRVRISNCDLDWLRKITDDYNSIVECRGVSEYTATKSVFGSSITCTNIVFWGQLPYHIFTTLCGKGAEGKKLPQFIFNLSDEYIQSFLHTYEFGDGYINTRHIYAFTTISPQLASDLMVLGAICGDKRSMEYRESKRAFTVRYQNGHTSKAPKTYIDDLAYDGYVYDLTVEDSHTFVDAMGPIQIFNTWMSCAPVTWGFEDKATRPFKAIQYVPIDHDPICRITKHGGAPDGGAFDLDWADQFRRYDKVVAYCKYGQDEINKLCRGEVCKDFIHHGVDNSVYHPLPVEERNRIKAEVFGLAPDDFLITCVARNQPRKLYPIMLEAVKKFIDKYEGNRKVYFYPHCPIQDVGWNLATLIPTYGLSFRMISQPPHVGRRVILNDSLKVGVGPPDEVLNQYYNAADLGLFIYNGEGWALPPMECMAAGTPTIMTKYSAPVDWAAGATRFVDPVYIFPEPQTNFMRAWVLPDPVVDAIKDVYQDKSYRSILRKAGLKVAAENDWNSIILPQWEEYLDNIEINMSSPKEVIYLRDADTLAKEEAPEVNLPKVSIIIPATTTPAGPEVLNQCIGGIRTMQYSNYELIIVDNGNWTPQDKDLIRKLKDTGAIVMNWTGKYSPAKVLNAAAKVATGEYLIFMDSDCIPQADLIPALFQCYTIPKCAIASLKLVHPRTGQFTTGLDYDNRLGFTTSMAGDNICEKHALSGSCMMIRSDLFRDIGGFDEAYTMFWQDVDLCCRIREKGLLPVCNTNSHVFHVGGISRRYLSKSLHIIDHNRLIRNWFPEYMPRKIDGTKDRERVAIVKLLTMGDAILITPILPLIRSKHPLAHITLYTIDLYADIFKGNPNIDEIKVVGPLAKEDFGPSWSLMAYDAVTYNILTSEGWDHIYLCNQLDYWMEYRRAGTTMAGTYAAMFGFTPEDTKYKIYLDDGNRKVARDLISEYPGDGPIVVMHTTAGWPLKEWTQDGWKELALRLYNKYNARTFIVGGPNEVLDSMYARNVGGQLSLRDIVALQSECDLFIGCDSGPLHLAKAANDGAGCPILGLFSCTNPMVVGFDDVDKYITLQSNYAGVVSCGFPSCPMVEKAKSEGRKFTQCSYMMDVENVWNAATTLLDSDQIREHRKGPDKCMIEYKEDEWEWMNTRIDGDDPPGMCQYGGDTAGGLLLGRADDSNASGTHIAGASGGNLGCSGIGDTNECNTG